MAHADDIDSRARRLELPFNRFGVDPYGISRKHIAGGCASSAALPPVLPRQGLRHGERPRARARHARRQSLRGDRHRRRDGHRRHVLRDGAAEARAGDGREVHQPVPRGVALGEPHGPVHGAPRARRATARGRSPAHGLPRGSAGHRQALQGAPLARRLRDGLHAARAQDAGAHHPVRLPRRRRGDSDGLERLLARQAPRRPLRPHHPVRSGRPAPGRYADPLRRSDRLRRDGRRRGRRHRPRGRRGEGDDHGAHPDRPGVSRRACLPAKGQSSRERA